MSAKNTFADRLLELDPEIRFVAVCDKDGNILYSNKRDDAVMLLSEQETKDSLANAAKAWRLRHSFEEKIGKGIYTLAVYEHLRRATFPLGKERLLFVTFGKKGSINNIVEHILGLLEGDYMDDYWASHYSDPRYR